jgi:2-polyprenyl-3-methyl-5-hydroxy-6-metoxy-1,4-benzoquinol methylase
VARRRRASGGVVHDLVDRHDVFRSIATGSTSQATTSRAPAFIEAIATVQEPEPTSSTARPLTTCGCGQGRLSRHLAKLGAEVTGVDVSAEMLGRARASGPPDIAYIQADVAGDLAWWDGRPFDGCTCEMALMDIDDLAGALSAVNALLDAGLEAERFTEPPAPVPTYLLWRCRR